MSRIVAILVSGVLVVAGLVATLFVLGFSAAALVATAIGVGLYFGVTAVVVADR